MRYHEIDPEKTAPDSPDSQKQRPQPPRHEKPYLKGFRSKPKPETPELTLNPRALIPRFSAMAPEHKLHPWAEAPGSTRIRALRDLSPTEEGLGCSGT